MTLDLFLNKQEYSFGAREVGSKICHHQQSNTSKLLSCLRLFHANN